MDSFGNQPSSDERVPQLLDSAVLFPTCRGEATSLPPHTRCDDRSRGAPATGLQGVRIKTRVPVRRLTASLPALSAEIVSIAERERFESEYSGPFHLLVAYEGVLRLEGESVVDGAHRSKLRDLRQKLTFVPAGRCFRESQELRAPGRVIYLYIDPDGLLLKSESGCVPIEAIPRLLFDGSSLGPTVRKLTRLIEVGSAGRTRYAEALAVVLAHELLCADRGGAVTEPRARGGLAGWQRRLVSEYLEEHLAEQVPLTKLAELTQLSACHFSRAFKQSFGEPPHRYHTSRRMGHAKALLAESALSVTDIALELGFSETSSFSVAFRKFTGRTPTGYRRDLI